MLDAVDVAALLVESTTFAAVEMADDAMGIAEDAIADALCGTNETASPNLPIKVPNPDATDESPLCSCSGLDAASKRASLAAIS